MLSCRGTTSVPCLRVRNCPPTLTPGWENMSGNSPRSWKVLMMPTPSWRWQEIFRGMRDVQVWVGHFFLVGGVFRESSIEEFIVGTVFFEFACFAWHLWNLTPNVLVPQSRTLGTRGAKGVGCRGSQSSVRGRIPVAAVLQASRSRPSCHGACFFFLWG